MKLSTQTDLLGRRFGYTRAVEMIAEAGFDAADFTFWDLANDAFFTDKYEKRAELLRRTAEKNSICFNQAHAPFPSIKGEPEYDRIMYEHIVRAIEVSGILGAGAIIVHPAKHLDYITEHDRLFKMNIEFYRSLLPHCKKAGVKLALENMFNRDKLHSCINDHAPCAYPEDFRAYLDRLDSPFAVACLDIGHCNLVGHTQKEFITALGGEKLKCLHVHENDFIDDRHTIPYIYGKTDWNEILSSLADIGYDGDLTFEADNFLENFEDTFIPEALAFMCKLGRTMIAKFNTANKV